MDNSLDAELDEELGYSKYDYRNKDTDNNRNGHSSKTLRTSFGDVEVSVSRDRKGESEPQILKKDQTSIFLASLSFMITPACAKYGAFLNIEKPPDCSGGCAEIISFGSDHFEMP